MDLGLYNVSMEDIKEIKINPSFRFLIMIDSFRFHKLASWLHSFAATKPSISPISETPRSEPTVEDAGDRLSRDEIKSVMGNLGIFCEEDSLPLFGSNEAVSKLFDEMPPCVAEVKEAFDVFDVNGDGFIDGEELQRILCVLGLKEGDGIENCRKMIRKFDENGDGRIDFEEFLKLMESAI